MLFSVYNQLLEGKNEVIVANMEADIAIDIVTIITRRIVGRISLACICGYQILLLKLNHNKGAIYNVTKVVETKSI
jgi:hypothetical protein